MTAEPQDPIHLAFSADCGYLPHVAVMLNSLLESNPGEQFELHLLQGPDLAVEDSRRLEAWLGARGIGLNRIVIGEDLLRDLRSTHFHRSIWYRVLLPDLLPLHPRVLYLDADTLVMDRLRPLWETDLGGHLFGAVVNPLYPDMPNWPVTHLGLPSGAHYMNSGMLLLDLDAMRKEGCVESLRHYSRTQPDYFCSEQDALAALYYRRCLFLHPRWNVQNTFYDLRPGKLPVKLEDVLEARRNPAIVHFIGQPKPSHYLCRHPYRAEYLRHRQATPWPLSDPEGRTLLRFILKQLPYVWVKRLVIWRDRLRQRFGLAGSAAQ